MISTMLLVGALMFEPGVAECPVNEGVRRLCSGDPRAPRVVMQCQDWAAIVSAIQGMGPQRFNDVFIEKLRTVDDQKQKYFRAFALDAFNWWNQRKFDNHDHARISALIVCGAVTDA